MNIPLASSPLFRRFQGQGAAAGLAGLLVLSYSLGVVAALWPNGPLFAVCALAGYVTETVVSRRTNAFTATLSNVGIGVVFRFAVREMALLVLLARGDVLPAGWLAAVAIGLVVWQSVRAVQAYAATLVADRRRLPALTRGFDLSALRVPGTPPWYVRQYSRVMPYLDVPVFAGALLAMAAGATWPVAAGIALTALAALSALAGTVYHARINRHLGDRAFVLRTVAEQVSAYAPEVILHFSGSKDGMYQVNTWLETFDRLEQRKMIVLRERANLPLLGPTDSPVLCIPGAGDLMNFPMLEDVRLALFPANTANNIHVLRLANITCVFIGHGDSDKTASFSPFSKVYDQVWVAGPAGRERYLRSASGVLDEDIVEVGRPQLAAISAAPTPDPMFTVLYAPTWEGWSGDPHHTSLAKMGPKIVRKLLDLHPHVRLLYKPHPLAGRDDVAVNRAHRKIVKLIETANAARDASGEWTAGTAGLAEARRRLDDLTARLARFGADDVHGRDAAEIAGDAVAPDARGAAEHRQAYEDCRRAYWDAEGWWRHRVITGSVPHLYDCFNHADLLITDVSSVVTDFVASGKPYVVTNGAGLPDEEFRRGNPSASGAYLLGPNCAGLAGIVTAVSGDGEDAMAPRRRELKRFLIGSAGDDAMAAFTRAVDDLVKERV